MKNKAISIHLTTGGQHSSPCWAGGHLLSPCRWHGPPWGEKGRGCALSAFEPWQQRAGAKGLRSPSAAPLCQEPVMDRLHLPKVWGEGRG